MSLTHSEIMSLYSNVRQGILDHITNSTFKLEAAFSKLSLSGASLTDWLISNEAKFYTRLIDQPSSSDPIPRIVHRLWLTSETNSHPPPPQYMDKIVKQAQKSEGVAQYIFWCNSNRVICDLQSELAHFASHIEVRLIQDVWSNHPLCAPIELALDNNKFVLAADICKAILLARFGGFYADLGIQFNPILLNLGCYADALIFLDDGKFFQPAFMAMRRDAEILSLWISVLQSPESMSSILMGERTQFTPGAEIWLHGGIAFTALAALFWQSANVLALPPQGSLLQTQSQGSWYREGNKFGNATLQDAPVTHVDSAKHIELVERAAMLRSRLIGFSPTEVARVALINNIFLLEDRT